jgi:dUTP pyrophosphatase
VVHGNAHKEPKHYVRMLPMKAQITRIDKSLPLPSYETPGSTGFDLITRETTTIEAGKIGLVPGNVVVKVPEGYSLLIVPRSSLPRKKALVCPHSIGVIDQDYCGPKDEIFVQVQNVSDEPVVIEKGERIAQGLFVRADMAEWEESETNEKSRGGFGSTDEKPTSYNLQPTS